MIDRSARLLAPLAWLLAACGGEDAIAPPAPDPPPLPAARLVVLSGDRQEGTVEAPFPEPFAVRAVDSLSRPVAGANVVFRAVSFGSRVDPVLTLTDSAGLAAATWTAGERAGGYAAQAVAVDPDSTTRGGAHLTLTDPVEVHAHAAPGPPDARSSPDSVTVAAGSTGPPPVRLEDTFGNRVAPDEITGSAWTSSRTDVAAVDAGGVFHAAAPGSTTLRLEAGSFRDSIRVTVAPMETLVERRTLAAGGSHRCAIDRDGGAWCWGSSESGALGNGSPEVALRPVWVSGGVAFASVWANGARTCGLTAEGALYCWGANRTGALGDGSFVDRATPTPVRTDLRFRSVGAGPGHTCAVAGSGLAYCWGTGTATGRALEGQGPYPVPVSVPGSGVYERIVAAGGFTCALTQDAEMECWGALVVELPAPVLSPRHFAPGPFIALEVAADDICGLAPDGFPECRHNRQRAFIPAPPKLAFRDLSIGIEHGCGILVSGPTWCWGRNTAGQLGRLVTPSLEPREPAPIDEDPGLVLIDGTCGLTAEGEAFCWGVRNQGLVGDGLLGHGSMGTPEPVVGGVTFTRLTAGETHTCGLSFDGKAWCWGDGERGQLGDATHGVREAPGLVAGGLAFAALSAADHDVCGLTGDGRLYCWGHKVRSAVPVAVEPDRTFVELADGRACALDAAGALHCVERSVQPAESLSSIRSVSIGRLHACGVDPRGAAVCWGENRDGALGRGAAAEGVKPPGPVLADADFVQIAAGQAHTCALDVVGKVWCWGLATDGQLGRGPGAPSPEDASLPATVASSLEFRRVVARANSTCALSAAGDILCWGRDPHGAVWKDPLPSPTPVAEGFGFVDLMWSTGGHACARDAAGATFCWGRNFAGQLGTGRFTDALLPTRVDAPVRFATPATGRSGAASGDPTR